MKPDFATTGIGSVPFDNVSVAIEFVTNNCPSIPFWPTMPNRSSKESMVEQYSEGLPGLKIENGMFVNLDDADLGQKIEQFYADYLAGDFDRYRISEEYATGLYELAASGPLDVLAAKGQVTGPVSFGLSLKDQNGKYVIYNDLYRDVYVKALALKVSFVESMLRRVCGQTIVFIDEPLLNTFGSAYFNMERSIIVDALKDTFSLSQGLRGIHACENCDWSLMFDANVDVISFDAYSFMDKFLLSKDRIISFIQGGGIIAWGIVPTTDELYRKRSSTELADILKIGFEQLEYSGMDISAMVKQSMITPACGVGTLSSDDAKYVFNLNAEVAAKIKSYFF